MGSLRLGLLISPPVAIKTSGAKAKGKAGRMVVDSRARKRLVLLALR